MSRGHSWRATLACLLVMLCGCGAKQTQLAVHYEGRADRGLCDGIPPERVLVEPGAGERPLSRLIDKAQNQVFLETYILTDQRVVHALQRAEAQGVKVWVLLERTPLGMGLQPQTLAQRLRAAGIQTRWTSNRQFRLAHVKMLVLDDRVAVVSTANFSRSAFGKNREVLVEDVNRRDVHELSNIFRRDWDHLSGPTDDPNLVLSPENSRAKIGALLRRARRSVSIYNEELQDPRIERLLSGLPGHLRVRVLLPATAFVPGLKRLLQRHVQIRALVKPYVHAKVFLVDGREALVGSENISSTSLDLNREVGVLIRGPEVKRLANVFERDWRRGSTWRR